MSELADEHGMDLHYGREAMPEHVHEWGQVITTVVNYSGATIGGPDITTICDCGETMPLAETLRHFNAVERLSGRQATYTGKNHREYIGDIAADALLAYAAALIGKALTP
jgi:hypothetical protein